VNQYEIDHPGRELVTVSEAYTPGKPDLLLRYVEPDQFHQSFTFDLLLSPWNALSFHKAAARSYQALHNAGATLTWALNNHDAHRVVTRYGRADAHLMSSWTGSNLVNSDAPVDLELGHRRARAAALLVLGLPGAAYLYMGEELGLPEVLEIPDSARQDPIFARTEGREKGRDGCRVPMPWTNSSERLTGFSTSANVESWMPQPEDWGSRSVEIQDHDSDSMLSLYRQALSCRIDMVKQGEEIQFIGDGTDGLFSFTRGSYAVVVNTSEDAVEIPQEIMAGRGLILGSQTGVFSAVEEASYIAANSAVWLG
jgi:alpha-glucosidase